MNNINANFQDSRHSLVFSTQCNIFCVYIGAWCPGGSHKYEDHMRRTQQTKVPERLIGEKCVKMKRNRAFDGTTWHSAGAIRERQSE